MQLSIFGCGGVLMLVSELITRLMAQPKDAEVYLETTNEDGNLCFYPILGTDMLRGTSNIYTLTANQAEPLDLDFLFGEEKF